ncbi:cysteine--tRNA ligase, chloroplastic/mitochondrial-like isoform X2 [Olea europaea var. sylvestris]|uniref:cysteine--tRNA ligase, chloroplastic/mitochondrial-like isoform X2 n=1 Tax=Olea europaea var. sylvestris TaxID=158386 RepID=UPI000C1D81A8|nr:cysteine--tRNA ligase, chloroplastic/mitochondrial-like isoform X2 [Olea europaea var. sylvestris]
MATLLKCYKPLIPPIHRQTFKAKLLSSRANFRFCTLSSINCSNNSLPLTSNRERSTTVNDDNDSLIPMKKKELWLYNTMSRQKELFKPKVAAKVGMYVCGVTAYDLSHIGHARVYVSFDVMYRYLKYLGYEVNYVRNFTDVDDKIIARANELGEDPINLSRRYCEEFHCDMAYLHCLPPSIEPRVSDHIPEIIEMIKQILDNGCAYTIQGSVYFSVDKFPDYGRLSGRKLEDNRAGERVAVDSRKKNPADFALWKSAKEGEPFWDSPWGPGRPGWHIECSAMSSTYLGYSFDIHGGGMDLIFPHHENEIAQSCAACHMSNVTYWIHNGFVTIDSEKMSKSLGNFFTIRQVLELYHPLALRLFLLGTHYRSPINYSEIQLESASDRIFYIYQTLHDCENILSQHDEASRKDSIPSGTALCIDKFNDEFLTSMSDDFHTPVTLAAMSEPLKTINDLLHTRKGKKQELRIVSLAALENTIRNVLTLLGLFPGSYTEALQELRDYALKRARLTEDQVLQKIEERNKARKNKQYEESDAIRKYLSDVGIALMDSPEGTTWRPAIPLALQEQLVAAS